MLKKLSNFAKTVLSTVHGLTIGIVTLYSYEGYCYDLDKFFLPLAMTDEIFYTYDYSLEKYLDNVLESYNTTRVYINGFSVFGFPENITGNGGTRFTIEPFSNPFFNLSGYKKNKIHGNLGIIGIGHRWQINERLDFLAASDLSVKTIVFPLEDVVEVLTMPDLTAGGYFRYVAKKDIIYDFGLIITHKLTTNLTSLQKYALMSNRSYREPEDDFIYEEVDYYAHLAKEDNYNFYYDSKFNWNASDIFFAVHKNYKLRELPSINLKLEDRVMLIANSISNLRVKMINIFNIHPDNVKEFGIAKNRLLWSPKNRASANLYGIFPFGRDSRNSIGASIDLGLGTEKILVVHEPSFQFEKKFMSSLSGIFTINIKYKAFLAEFSIEGGTKLEIYRINFGFGLRI